MNILLEERLTDEQVKALLQKYVATKNVELRDLIVIQYKNLVESVARKFIGSGEPIEDLIQEGYIGLITAVDLYDISKGVKFSTYATHFIIGQIKHALRDKGKIIKEPAWLQELNHRMTRVINSLSQEFGRQPTESEIGTVMHLPEETIAELLTTREVFKVSSLDGDHDDSYTNGTELERVKDDKFTEFQLPVEDKIVLEMAVDKLKLVEQKVIQEFYFNGRNQTEIAKKLGISCNYVSHILRSGTKKLRRILTTAEIQEMQIQLQRASRRSDGMAAIADSTVVDQLTGLYNRDYIQNRLEEELMRAAGIKSEIAIAIISLHGMHEFSKKFGLINKENAVCQIGTLIKNTIRKCDLIGRFDEYSFMLVLPYTGMQVSRVNERVYEAIQKMEFVTVGSKVSMTFDIDIGSAVYPVDASNAKDLISIAKSSLESASNEQLRKSA